METKQGIGHEVTDSASRVLSELFVPIFYLTLPCACYRLPVAPFRNILVC